MTARTGPAERVSLRALQASILLAAAVAAGSLAAWLPPFLSSLTRGVTAGVLGGNDFAMYFTASTLGSADRWVDAYTLAGLSDAMGLRLGAASFAYPPMLAQMIYPLTTVEYAAALAIWFAACIGILAIATPLVLGRPGMVALAGMGIPIYVALRFGQFVPFAVGVLLLATLAIRRERLFLAGLALGLMVLKPQFLVGPLLLALFDRTLRPALRGMLTSAGSLVAVSYVIDPSAWVAFLAGLRETASPSVSSRWDYSILRLLDPLPGAAEATGYVITAVVLAALCVRASRSATSIQVKMALAVALSVALSPRMLVYDWTLLLVVGVWMVPAIQSIPRLRWPTSAVVLASMSGHSMSPLNVGWPVLAVAIVWFATSIAALDADAHAL